MLCLKAKRSFLHVHVTCAPTSSALFLSVLGIGCKTGLGEVKPETETVAQFTHGVHQETPFNQVKSFKNIYFIIFSSLLKLHLE